MTTTLYTTADKETCSTLLTESNRLYTQMLTLLGELNNSPEAGSELQLAKRNSACSDLQGRIQAVDAELGAALRTVAPEESGFAHLLAERQDLMHKVYAVNRTALNKVEAVKSLLADEIRKCATGHAALQGYRRSENSHGGSTFKRIL